MGLKAAVTWSSYWCEFRSSLDCITTLYVSTVTSFWLYSLHSVLEALGSGSLMLCCEEVLGSCCRKGCVWRIHCSTGPALALCLTHWVSLCAPRPHANSFHYRATPLVLEISRALQQAAQPTRDSKHLMVTPTVLCQTWHEMKLLVYRMKLPLVDKVLFTECACWINIK